MIRRVFTVVVISFLAYSNSLAQRFSCGLKPGIDIVDQQYKGSVVPPASFNPRISWDIAGYCNFKLSKRIQIQVEPGYAEKGSSLLYIGATKPVILTYGYIQTPLILKISPVKKLFIDLGAEFGYLVSSRRQEEDGTVHYSTDLHNANRNEFSGLLGLSYILTTRFSFSIRYSYQFKPIFDGYAQIDPGPSVPYKIFNRQLCAGLYYAF